MITGVGRANTTKAGVKYLQFVESGGEVEIFFTHNGNLGEIGKFSAIMEWGKYLNNENLEDTSSH